MTGNRALQATAASCSGAVPSADSAGEDTGVTEKEDRGVPGAHSRILAGRTELDSTFQKRFPYTLKKNEAD